MIGVKDKIWFLREGLFANSAQWLLDTNGNRVGTFKYEDRERLRQGR